MGTPKFANHAAQRFVHSTKHSSPGQGADQKKGGLDGNPPTQNDKASPGVSLTLEEAKDLLREFVRRMPFKRTEDERHTMVLQTNMLIARQPRDQHPLLYHHLQVLLRERAACESVATMIEHKPRSSR